MLACGLLLCFAVSTKASIYIDGQLYSGNILEITDSSYNNSSITTTGDSVLNIYYEDEFVGDASYGFYQPAIHFDLMAQDNSVVNFIYPENCDFTILWWHINGSDYSTLTTYPGLQIDSNTRPAIANQSELFRDYDPSIPHVLTPIIGDFELQDDAFMNFVPEPATLLFLCLGSCALIRKTR